MDQAFVRKRLEEIIKERRLSMRQVSLRAGLNEAAVRNIITGRTLSIGLDVMRQLFTALDLNEDQFFQREQKSFTPPMEQPAKAEFRIPIMGEIPAGNPTWTDGQTEPLDTFPGDEHDRRVGAFGLRVCGHSMAPRYLPGDLLILRSTQIGLPVKDPSRPTPRATFDALAGRSVAVLVNGEATLKRLEIEPIKGGDYLLHFKPINPEYPTITIGDDDTALIQGEVYRLIRAE